MGENARISVLIPVHNEARTLRELHRRLSGSSPPGSEFIYVDDGSSDGGDVALAGMAHADPSVRVVRLVRNYGKTAALAAGLSVARGNWVAILDADLQHEPADLLALLSKAREGYDVVVGWRRKRRDSLLKKRLPSLIANRLISTVSGLPIHDCGCGLQVIRRQLLDELPLAGDMHRLLPMHLYLRGARVAEVVVRHAPRRYGASHYGFTRVFPVLVDLLAARFQSSQLGAPMRVCLAVILLVLVLSLVAGVRWLTLSVAADPLLGEPFLLASLLLAGTALLAFLLGLLAEVVARAAVTTWCAKTYSIEKTINC